MYFIFKNQLRLMEQTALILHQQLNLHNNFKPLTWIL